MTCLYFDLEFASHNLSVMQTRAKRSDPTSSATQLRTKQQYSQAAKQKVLPHWGRASSPAARKSRKAVAAARRERDAQKADHNMINEYIPQSDRNTFFVL
eukprot:COSAG02_NODE_1021_length_15159_cov_24.514739_7_plen_100_part_00